MCIPMYNIHIRMYIGMEYINVWELDIYVK